MKRKPKPRKAAPPARPRPDASVEDPLDDWPKES